MKLAEAYPNSLILMDDASARKIAENLGYNVKGTFICHFISSQKKNNFQKIAREIINRLVSSGFRMSIELYIKVIEGLKE